MEISHHHDLHQSKDDHATTGRTLILAIIINCLIPAVQIVGGIYANSVAILSDALHNLGDVLTLGLTYIAFTVARKTATSTHTFGYKRAEVIAALLNTIVIMGASAIILKEAIVKLLHPEPVSGKLVMGLAVVGMIGNGLSAWLLHHHSHHNINVRSAVLHLVGDFLTSFAVFVGGVVLIFKPWHWIDPLLSFVIVAFIARGCWNIFRDTLRILMEATPPDVNLQKVKESIENIQGVLGAHYLHAWMVHPSSVAFSCHVVVEDQPLSKITELRKTIENVLKYQFKINHPVLQFETAHCGNGGLLCELSCTSSDTGITSTDDEHHATEAMAYGKESFNNQRNKLDYKELIFTVLRIIFGGIFIFASIDKILHPKAFAEVVFYYQLLPDVLINLVAISLPWIEAVAGLSVIIGRGVLGGLAILNCLLVIFTASIFLNIARGIDITCGCFSTEISTASKSVMWLEVARDLVLLGVGVILLRHYIRKFFGRSSHA